MAKSHTGKTAKFLFYSRTLFRTCEIASNHAARIFFKRDALARDAVRDELDQLNKKRIDYHHDLNAINASHGRVCADCKGECCGGFRERDTYIDRIIQYPDTPHLRARRRDGEMAAHKLMADRSEGAVAVMEAEWVEGHCPELTTQGCRIPYELRPIQCVAYFCRKTIDELSPQECDKGIRALAGLMRVQLRTVRLAIRSRLR